MLRVAGPLGRRSRSGPSCSSEAIRQSWSFSGLSTDQMRVILSPVTSNAYTATISPSRQPTRPGCPLTMHSRSAPLAGAVRAIPARKRATCSLPL